MQNSTSPERVPREALHDQHERLTTKHIQTLSFLQDIANENKQLKARVEQLELIQNEYEGLQQMTETSQDRIKQIQAEYLHRADDINAMLAEKHKTEILQMVDEKLEIERNAHQQISMVQREMEILEQNNHEMSHRLATLSQTEAARQALQEELEVLHKEHGDLKSEHTQLQQVSDSKADIHHMHGLKSQNEALAQQVKELAQKNDELEYKLHQLERELKERPDDAEKITLIENLRNKVDKLHKEKIGHVQQLDDFEMEVCKMKNENEKLKVGFVKLERGKEAIALEFKQCFYELQALKRRLSLDQSRKTFKDFVQVKRELNILKDENEFLRQRNKNTIGRLPFLRSERPTSGTKASSSAKETSKKKTLALMSAVSS